MPSSIASQILCVDIGGTSTKAAVFSSRNQIEFLEAIPTKPDTESYFAALTGLLARTVQTASAELKQQVTQLGVAIAGFLDSERSHLVYNSNLAWLERFPLRERLRDAFPELKIEFEVDSNAATLAEFKFGSGKGSHRFLCVTCGTGLGVGMAIDGVPVRFAYGCLGDIGHIVVQRDGPICTCGGRGCAEILVSAPALAQEYRTLSGARSHSTLRDVIEAAQAGDRLAISVLERAGGWLGVAIASMANTFFPDHIAIAGGLSAGGEFVLNPAERVFRETASVLARSKATFTRATLGSEATLIGAAWPFLGKEEIS